MRSSRWATASRGSSPATSYPQLVAVSGNCRACNRGEPWYCFATFNATQKMTLEDGTELSPALGIGAFAEKTLVAAGQCTKVHASARAVRPACSGGRDGRPGRRPQHRQRQPGQDVATIGCGGVGSAAIVGSALAGASKIIAVDLDDRKLDGARKLGATDVVNSSWTDPVEAIQALTDGYGADVVIDAVGRAETWKQAFYARDLAGTVVLVGVPTPDMKIPDIPLLDVFGRGGALKSSWYGDCLPTRDFPMLVDLYRQGRLDLDAFVSEEIGLGDVEAAFEKMHHGDVLRSVVIFTPELRLMSGLMPGPKPARVDHAVVSGTFSLDGETFDVDNNIWVVGDDEECVVIDAPHDVDAILAVVAGREVKAILCTHAHDDHVRVAPALRERVTAPILLHPADKPVDSQPRRPAGDVD